MATAPSSSSTPVVSGGSSDNANAASAAAITRATTPSSSKMNLSTSSAANTSRPSFLRRLLSFPSFAARGRSRGRTKRLRHVSLTVTSCCQGPGNYTKSKEDRILIVDDLEEWLWARGIDTMAEQRWPVSWKVADSTTTATTTTATEKVGGEPSEKVRNNSHVQNLLSQATSSATTSAAKTDSSDRVNKAADSASPVEQEEEPVDEEVLLEVEEATGEEVGKSVEGLEQIDRSAMVGDPITVSGWDDPTQTVRFDKQPEIPTVSTTDETGNAPSEEATDQNASKFAVSMDSISFFGNKSNHKPDSKDGLCPPDVLKSRKKASKSMPILDIEAQERRIQIKLFAVFDGHCGAVASTYLAQHLPLHIYRAPSFTSGDFSAALKEAYQSIHKELLEWDGYKPEAPGNDFSSGSTASVVLTAGIGESSSTSNENISSSSSTAEPTKEKGRTWFAFLGDSPIIVWRRKSERPQLLFKEHDIDNPSLHQYIISSSIFLVGIREHASAASGFGKHSYALLRDTNIKREVLKRNMYRGEFTTVQNSVVTVRGTRRKVYGQYKYDDVRVGLSALNVWGTLGDSIYDVEVFNTILKEIEAFRAENKIETKKTGAGNSNSNNNNNGEWDVSYLKFRAWLLKRPTWSFISRHLSLLDSETRMSKVFLRALRELSSSDYLTSPGLLRDPEVTSIPNDELRLFLIASDGVIRFYDRFRDDYEGVIMKWGESKPQKCVEELKKFLIWIGDDRSVVLGNYDKPS